MTRALQTAAIIAAGSGVPLSVEFDLREWVPDIGYGWVGGPYTQHEEMLAAGGEWPPGETRCWGSSHLGAETRRRRPAPGHPAAIR